MHYETLKVCSMKLHPKINDMAQNTGLRFLIKWRLKSSFFLSVCLGYFSPRMGSPMVLKI